MSTKPISEIGDALEKRPTRRFGAREVTKGKWTGSIHVAPRSYTSFQGQLVYLADYLNRRLLPSEPEELNIARITSNLQNLLEYELELVIEDYVAANKSKKNETFLKKIQTEFVSFKNKFAWACAKKLISQDEYAIMEQIRLIRNKQVHSRPTKRRIRLKYFDKNLITRAAIMHLFKDANKIVLRLRSISKNPEKWPVIPPGYAEEMGW